MSDETDSADFLPEDYRFTAELLRAYCKQDFSRNKQDLFRAVCSNNLNIILAALDKAAEEKS